MSEHKIQIKYVEGINLLFNNPKIVLSRKNEDDMNGYSKIYFDKSTGDLIESYYIYDDCGSDDGIKNNCHKINLNNDLLYIDGWYKENILFYVKMKWDMECTWLDILKIADSKSRSEAEEEVFTYLKDVYYNAINHIDDSEFNMDVEKIDRLLDILSDLV